MCGSRGVCCACIKPWLEMALQMQSRSLSLFHMHVCPINTCNMHMAMPCLPLTHDLLHEVLMSAHQTSACNCSFCCAKARLRCWRPAAM